MSARQRVSLRPNGGGSRPPSLMRSGLQWRVGIYRDGYWRFGYGLTGHGALRSAERAWRRADRRNAAHARRRRKIQARLRPVEDGDQP